MSETKAAIAERTIRSLKNLLYRYMEDNRYKYFHKLTHLFRTLKSRRLDLIPKKLKNSDFLSILYSSIDLILKKVKNSDILSILYSKPLREVRKPKFENGERVRISKYDLPFRKSYKPQFAKKSFQNCCHFFQKTSNIHNKG